MKRSIFAVLALVSVASVVAVVSAEIAGPTDPVDPVNETELASKPRRTMRAFRSEYELKEHFRKLQEQQNAVRRRSGEAEKSANASASPTMSADGLADKKEDDSVTNNQHGRPPSSFG